VRKVVVVVEVGRFQLLRVLPGAFGSSVAEGGIWRRRCLVRQAVAAAVSAAWAAPYSA
jgi:hypothetical protein